MSTFVCVTLLCRHQSRFARGETQNTEEQQSPSSLYHHFLLCTNVCVCRVGGVCERENVCVCVCASMCVCSHCLPLQLPAPCQCVIPDTPTHQLHQGHKHTQRHTPLPLTHIVLGLRVRPALQERSTTVPCPLNEAEIRAVEPFCGTIQNISVAPEYTQTGCEVSLGTHMCIRLHQSTWVMAWVCVLGVCVCVCVWL